MAYNWCFTINANEVEAPCWVATATPEIPPVNLYDDEVMKACFYQLERASTGQIHIQGIL